MDSRCCCYLSADFIVVEIHEVADVSVGGVLHLLGGVDEALGEIHAEVDVVAASAPLPIFARVHALREAKQTV